MNRDIQDLELHKPVEDSVELTPNSSACSNLDLDDSLLQTQVMLNCMFSVLNNYV